MKTRGSTTPSLTMSILAALVSAAAGADDPCRHGPACQLLSPGASAPAGADFSDRLWPGGVVPYQFDANVNAENRARMSAAFDDLENWADVAFVPRRGDEPFWINIRRPRGSNRPTVGRAAGGVLTIRSCEAPGFLIHELMHTLGFIHEHQRPDPEEGLLVLVHFHRRVTARGGSCT